MRRIRAGPFLLFLMGLAMEIWAFLARVGSWVRVFKVTLATFVVSIVAFRGLDHHGGLLVTRSWLIAVAGLSVLSVVRWFVRLHFMVRVVQYGTVLPRQLTTFLIVAGAALDPAHQYRSVHGPRYYGMRREWSGGASPPLVASIRQLWSHLTMSMVAAHKTIAGRAPQAFPLTT